ncbi:hypothetical protein ACFQHV_06555 [Promicromonospora thailandica]|uniref:Uncharacterized protein n=1 Tax=Promicromonospora thailandica TaxID=765201 RepID=A0A9X2G6D1_9MICO|nr:hypothetical protein [Promicromonospora thailandica]MCP2266398.1 hypothetical protein [Promicromonospora thailandica]BFF20077.1 hypothetical protein GCM10025730_35980 [Promicromonospora thailandica]
MISVSLLVVLLIAAWIAVQYGKAKVATMLLGVCLGLALANTSFGAWGLDALNALLNNLFTGANNMVEG